MKYCSDTCDGIRAISADVKELRREIQLLAKSNLDLKTEHQRLVKKIDELEQYRRAKNLEIKGVPAEGDLAVALVKIGEVIGEPINVEDIDICHRLSTQKSTKKNIVVRFVRRSKRRAILEKARRTRGVTTDSLGFPNSTPIYVNEHLT